MGNLFASGGSRGAVDDELSESLESAMRGVERLSREDHEEGVDVMCEAFSGRGGLPEMTLDWLVGQQFKGTTPLFVPLSRNEAGRFPDLPERERCFRYLMDWTFQQCVMFGTILAIRSAEDSTKFAAVMCFLSPGQVENWWMLLWTIWRIGIPPWYSEKTDEWQRIEGRLRTMHEVFKQAEKEIAHQPHLKLYAIAVRPSEQGKGLGKRLLLLISLLADVKRVPVYLECSGARNEAMYCKFGYRTARKACLEQPADPLNLVAPFRENGGCSFMLRPARETVDVHEQPEQSKKLE